MIGYIYLIENIINRKIYIGQTIGKVKQRWAVHCSSSNNSNSAVTKAILKYGKHNFKISIVEIIEDGNRENLFDKLNMLEKSYIQAWNSLIPNGYNILLGGKNAAKPESVRRKISSSLKGHPSRKIWLGKKFSKEHRENISKSQVLSKSLICLENNEIYHSIAEASRKLNIPRTSLSKSLRKKGIYEGVFTLKYSGK